MHVTEYPFRPTMQKVFWKDVRNAVQKISPVFAKLVDEIDPGKDYPLYKACYPYGSLIVRSGVCYYPNKEGKLVTLNDSSLATDVKKDLGYAGDTLPAGMVLEKSVETFIPTKYQNYPWKFHTPGYVFALWLFLEKQPSFHPNRIFNITSGARSIFLLPNIGDAIYHKHLRLEFGIRSSPPKDLLSEWELFTLLSNHPIARCDWHSELLYFSGKWLEKIHKNDKTWNSLSGYLSHISWQNSAFLRNKIFYDFAFSRVQAERNLRPNPYIADTAKHLLSVAAGALPGFAPAIDNLGAPIDILQKIFIEVYRLKKYAPTFMHPHWFELEHNTRPVYYSLILPTSLEFSPNCRKERSTLNEVRELAHILGIYLEEIPKDYLNISNTPMGIVANKVKFEYYHDKVDREKYTKHTSEMPKLDSTLISCPEGYNNKIFPFAARFLRGCVKISVNGI